MYKLLLLLITSVGTRQIFLSGNPIPVREKMDERTIDGSIAELARLLDYDSPSQTNLRKAMCVNKEGDYSDANYSNNSLATVGDSVLKLILSDYLYSKG